MTMGRVVRFRARRRLRGLNEFDRKQHIRFWPEPSRSPLRRLVFALRPFVLAAILVALWAVMDPALVEPPTLLSSEPEQVSETFTLCGAGRGPACVIDGDTFKLGERKVRIIGTDTPETHPPRCAEEARLGEQATVKLQELLNQGAFEMVAPVYRTTDRYGRDLRVIRRKLPDGSYESIADEMRGSGLARRYLGGFRMGWC